MMLTCANGKRIYVRQVDSVQEGIYPGNVGCFVNLRLQVKESFEEVMTLVAKGDTFHSQILQALTHEKAEETPGSVHSHPEG